MHVPVLTASRYAFVVECPLGHSAAQQFTENRNLTASSAGVKHVVQEVAVCDGRPIGLGIGQLASDDLRFGRPVAIESAFAAFDLARFVRHFH